TQHLGHAEAGPGGQQGGGTDDGGAAPADAGRRGGRTSGRKPAFAQRLLRHGQRGGRRQPGLGGQRARRHRRGATRNGGADRLGDWEHGVSPWVATRDCMGTVRCVQAIVRRTKAAGTPARPGRSARCLACEEAPGLLRPRQSSPSGGTTRPSGSTARRPAISTAWVRLPTPSLRRTAVTWALIVASETPR